jgi:hypothetical protein
VNDSDPGDPTAGGTPSGEDVGSVGEEAAKLFAAISGWAKEQGVDYAGNATGAASSMAGAVHNVSEHIATGSDECRYCPVCQVIHAVRQTSPEVRTHLAIAASSLMHAAAAIMATPVPHDKAAPTEKINLDDEKGWDEDQ